MVLNIIIIKLYKSSTIYELMIINNNIGIPPYILCTPPISAAGPLSSYTAAAALLQRERDPNPVTMCFYFLKLIASVERKISATPK